MLRKLLPSLIIALLAFAAGGYFFYQWQNRVTRSQEIEATVLLEKVRQVCKLVTIEGQFSEVYNEDNYRQITLYLPLPTNWSFKKSALLQVQGNVLVGYDLKKMSITVDSAARTVTLYDLPKTEILAIDHQLTYRDLSESFFNGFSAEDYTQLNKNAKEVLREKAYESGLLDDANEQGLQVLEGLRYLVEGVGYTLILDRNEDRGTRTEVPDSFTQ